MRPETRVVRVGTAFPISSSSVAASCPARRRLWGCALPTKGSPGYDHESC